MLLVTLCIASTILRTLGASGSAGQISAVVYDMAAGGTASGRRSDNSKRMLRAPAAGGSAGPSNVVCAALVAGGSAGQARAVLRATCYWWAEMHALLVAL